MPTYHLHVTGRVQGVGFRPAVYERAIDFGMRGWVKNSPSGLEVVCTGEAGKVKEFFEAVLRDAPAHAIITGSEIQEIPDESFSGFSILDSGDDGPVSVMMPPDRALCESCRLEIDDPKNRRYRYAFTTCLHCGPRYSVIQKLPYNREGTSMMPYRMCRECETEYRCPGDRHFHAQANSCPDCAITIRMHGADGNVLSDTPEEIFGMFTDAIRAGKTVAVKGLGGYLLMADASNAEAIGKLRERKKRPNKPFALMYPDLEMATSDVNIRPFESEALLGPEAPIVLCRMKGRELSVHGDLIAPGLDTLGIMLPNTPLFHILLKDTGIPLIATSANLSGAPIIYRDADALSHLGHFADLILTYDREIVVPQDDSVVRFTDGGLRILLRRSRGFAPAYFPPPFKANGRLAAGGELKNAFAFESGDNLIVSQFLGDQESYESQQAYLQVFGHLRQMYGFVPREVLADLHIGYFVTQQALDLAKDSNSQYVMLQHHKAHFAAVLAENGLLSSPEPIMGVIWDGLGLGDDGHLWGGEFFLKRGFMIDRVMWFRPFSVIADDKMSREPRISAISMLEKMPDGLKQMEEKFTANEWAYYKLLLGMGKSLMTDSVGRIFDAVAAMIGICDINTYEGEAAARLEALARHWKGNRSDRYRFSLKSRTIDWRPVLRDIVSDLKVGTDKSLIAASFHWALARAVVDVANDKGVRHVALSGGVFQNAMLMDCLLDVKPSGMEFHFHKQLSPNDENIGFGQLALRG